MNILFVGALSWNPERFISLCARGHKLFGLWTKTMAWEQGPYSFAKGFITDIALDDYIEVIKKEKIDIIYSLFQSYKPDAWSDLQNDNMYGVWDVLRKIFTDRNKGLFDVPIVRHWGFDTPYLDNDILTAFDGHIFCNKEKYVYWTTSKNRGGLGIDLPHDSERIIFMDSDMPKQEFMNNNFTKKLSDIDGQIHTVCIGRPFGFDYNELTKRGVCIHIYCNNYRDACEIISQQMSFRDLTKLSRKHIHINSSLQVINESLEEIRAKKSQWVSEFSKYDAGWSYVNIQNMMKWDLLDDKAAIPNRLSTYVLAGLPIIAEVLPGYYRYDILKKNGINIDFDPNNYDELYKRLNNKETLYEKTERAKACRQKFSFDYYIDNLIGYFQRIRRIYFSKPRSFDKMTLMVRSRDLMRRGDGSRQKKTISERVRYVCAKIKEQGLISISINRVKWFKALIFSPFRRKIYRIKVDYIKRFLLKEDIRK